MDNKVIAIIVVLVALVGVSLSLAGVSKQQEAEAKILKVGAIFPISGDAAIYGENLRNAMELALVELREEGAELEVIYEDSEGDPARAVSAYRKLVGVDQVDVIVSALSRVSTPLVSLAETDRIPLLMTIVSSQEILKNSEYAFRFYNTADQYIKPLFDDVLSAQKYLEIVTLYVNDEFGSSVNEQIKIRAEEGKIKVTGEESFTPGSGADFRTQLTNIKELEPDAIIFVSIAPSDAINILKQAKELEIEADLFDGSSVLSGPLVREGLDELVEGLYISATPFVRNETGEVFREKYEATYGKKPTHAAPYGFDVLKFITKLAQGESLSSEEFLSRIRAESSYESLNGELLILGSGEINPSLRAVRVENNELIIIE